MIPPYNSFGELNGKIRLVANTQTYDLILGRWWCHERKAMLDCYTNEVYFSHKNSV